MWWNKKKQEPESIDWLEVARKDMQDFVDEIKPKLIALNQKHFKKDTGFKFINGNNDELVVFTTPIEGLGMINEYFYLALHRECFNYLRATNGTAADIIGLCDALKEGLLKKCIVT